MNELVDNSDDPRKLGEQNKRQLVVVVALVVVAELELVFRSKPRRRH